MDKKDGYPVPYRCFYSRNVDNLFMAGRCLSVTHEALGTVRVMRTCGMMGEVVGKAAYLCIREKTNPRGVYQSHLEALKELLRLPGGARRERVEGGLTLTEKPLVLPPSAGDKGRAAGISPAKLGGLVVIDDSKAKFTGQWTHGTGSFGITIGDPAYWGQGYGPEAIFLALRYAFLELNLYRVASSTMGYNLRSQRAHEKAGFHREGTDRAAVLRQGRRYDVIRYGILRDEWLALHGIDLTVDAV